MQICYVDESGKAATLTRADGEQQPVFVVGGITLPETRLTQVTHEWIELKARYYQKPRPDGWLDGILLDPKGTSLRRGFRAKASVRQRKHAVGVIDGALKILERHDARIVARVWLKELDTLNDEMKMHSSALQFICGAFHAGLADEEHGMVVVDSQTHQTNYRLAHSMFIKRFGKNPPYPRLVDMPVFGHSENHAGLQLADIVCSAYLAPVTCAVYGGRYSPWNGHCDSRFLDIRERFGERLHGLTYEWHNVRTTKDTSSVVVHDPVGKRSSKLLWGPTADPTRPPKPRAKPVAAEARQRKQRPRRRGRGSNGGSNLSESQGT